MKPLIPENKMDNDVSLLLNQLYPDFNARAVDRILPYFAEDADWPNGMTGGREVGHEAIRRYWTEQWKVIDSTVTPVSYRVVDDQIILEVHQHVKDMQGATLSDGVVYHTYQFAEGRVARMDISEAVPAAAELVRAVPI